MLEVETPASTGRSRGVARGIQQFGDQLAKSLSEPVRPLASVSRSPYASHAHLSLTPPLGEGYLESIELPSGLVISRKDCAFSRPLTSHYSQVCRTLGFSVVLAGRYEVELPHLKLSNRIRAGSVWVSGGHLASVTTRHCQGEKMTGIGLDLPEHMVEAWKDEAPESIRQALRHRFAEGEGMCARYAPITPALHRLAQQMLRCSTSSLCARLEYESLALGLLAFLLRAGDDHGMTAAERRHARQKRQIREAQDILHAEWRCPPTITQLASRVGMNECYLKSGFKDVVGMTIGQYVRSLRMEHARHLLARQGYTVQQAALEVGFSNPSHFAAAFRTHFGYRPSETGRGH